MSMKLRKNERKTSADGTFAIGGLRRRPVLTVYVDKFH